MLNVWGVIALQTLRQDRHPREPFADPLDRPEWRGLTWIFDRQSGEPTKSAGIRGESDQCEPMLCAAVGPRPAD